MKYPIASVFWVIFVGFQTLFAWQPQPDEKPVTSPAQVPDMGWLLFKAILALLAILALIVAIVFVVKRFWGGQLGNGLNPSWIEIIARTSIYPKQSLALVKILDRVVLLGITENNIQTLVEFPDSDRIEKTLEQLRHSGNLPGKAKFWGMLTNKLQGR